MLPVAVASAAADGGSWLQSVFGTDGTQLAVQVLQIIGIDILLAGDNAVVIAMACRSLPPKQRKWGILLGALVAVAMRIAFAGGITILMSLPWLKIVGGLLLVWIAVKLLQGGDEAGPEVESSTGLFRAVRTVAIADLVMSLDNVIAIAGAAKGNVALIAFGLLISIPLIIAGATLIMTLLTRYPILIWLGAMLLGWIAGEMIVSDPAATGIVSGLSQAVGYSVSTIGHTAAVVGAVIVALLGWLLTRRRHHATSHG